MAIFPETVQEDFFRLGVIITSLELLRLRTKVGDLDLISSSGCDPLRLTGRKHPIKDRLLTN